MSKTGSKAGVIPILHLLEILLPFSRDICIIMGDFGTATISKKYPEISILKVSYPMNPNLFLKIINYVSMQLKFSFALLKLMKYVDYCIFFIMGQNLILPMLIAKLLQKKVTLVLAVSTTRTLEVQNKVLSRSLNFISKIGYFLSDSIVIYSRSLITQWNLRRYRHKIIISHEHFIDFTKFMIRKRINERANVIGYIGRFAKEKGILNLVRSISLVLNHRKNVCFMLCGEGELSDEIRKIIQRKDLEGYVKLTGWISHADIPNFLNDFKLLVLPSYTEGLPNVMLEAMACGTPVLATRVGAIPDIIKDNETGFLLKSNDPKHIAERIVELLNKPELLEKVSINAYNYVRENFSYEKTLQTWRKILKEQEAQK
jgi:glycosyltransferase involved in cell wall biosynthesis